MLLVVAGIAFGFLLGQGTTDDPSPADTESVEAITSTSAPADPVVASELPAEEVVRFPGTILASVEFGRGLVTWPGDGSPVKIRLASKVSAAAYDAAQRQIAVTVPEYGTETLALHVGNVGDLRFVASRVTGFAWHPTDPSAIAWVEESEDGFALLKADVSDGAITATQITVLARHGSTSGVGLVGIRPPGRKRPHDDRPLRGDYRQRATSSSWPPGATAAWSCRDRRVSH